MARSRNNELRQRILMTSYMMFMQGGFKNVLMKDIAAACDISVSLLHHYFSKKEDILIHIFFDMIAKVNSFIVEKLGGLVNECEYPELYYGLFYRLFYDILSRNNDALLKIYIYVLNDASLLKAATDFAFRSLPPVGKLSNDYEKRLGVYILNGSLSQVANIYLSNNPPISLERSLRRVIDAYYVGLGYTAQQQRDVRRIAEEALTTELMDECCESYISSIANFINCEW